MTSLPQFPAASPAGAIVDNPAAIRWPNTPDGDYACRYLTPLLEQSTAHYIANIHTRLQVVQLDDLTIPITIPPPTPSSTLQSYVVSPYNHYFTYTLEELDKLQNPTLEVAIRAAFAPLRWLYRVGEFDKAVMVNNWLLSTNLWPQITPDQVRRLVMLLAERYPTLPIVFRSVDRYANPILYDTLESLGAMGVFSRKIYYQPLERVQATKDYKNDRALYRKTPYTLLTGEQLTHADLPRLLELYNLLYIDKYSRLNPQFTLDFLRLALDHHLLELRAFARDGRIDAVMGYFTRRGIMTQPLFGYDTRLPQNLGLYRLLSMQVFIESEAQGLLVNSSSGVGKFKRLRGGVGVHEVNMVYLQHLSHPSRWLWGLLQQITQRVAVPMIDKNEF
ncbi:MAG: GNAT family N-acetyltransferase [Phototrophicaceae bacterium]|jgi:hypothetical protein